jgi:RNA polymerase sigma factor (sigma-70 family)
VSVRLPSRAREREADEIATANYEPLKEEVLRSVAGKLRSEGITTMIPQDLEAAYNTGWHGVMQHIIQGKPLTSLAGLLYTITHRRALDIYRAKHERKRVEIDLEQQRIEVDLAEQIDDQDKLNRLLRRLRDRLNETERLAVTLCVLHGYTRPEAPPCSA